MAQSETSPYPQSSPGLGQPVPRSAFLPRSPPGRDRSPSGPHRRRGAVGDIALPPELPGPRPACSKIHVPSPNHLPGRDRSPTGPAPQTLALSETSPYPQSSLGLGQPVARSAFLPRTTSQVGTDLRAVRHRRHGAVGDIALPPELPGPWPACSKTRVPSPKTSPVGTDLIEIAPNHVRRGSTPHHAEEAPIGGRQRHLELHLGA